jgi:hypothetical protein
MQAWGSSDPDYDLNGDKVVNVQDLVEFISSWPKSDPQPEAPDHGKTPAGVLGAQPTVEGLMAAWGQTDSPYALNGDGTVNVQDLSQLYEDWPMMHTGGGLTALPPALPARIGQLDGLTNTLLDKLAAAGFDQRPPANIAALVDGLGLDLPSRQYVLSRVAERYPHGLGINVVG